MSKKVESPAQQHKRERKTTERKRSKKRAEKLFSMPILKPDSAGVDIGATEIWVAVAADRAAEPVRRFDSFTQDLHAIVPWLKQCGIRTVAMESTGVYWIPLFQVLSDEGFELLLVNARHYKNVPGRKTDVQDCQWLQFLLSVGLVRGSHRPDQAFCAIRTLLRHRNEWIVMAAQHVQHIQKALEQMNVKLTHVISDVMGVTGTAILDAILAGERDPLQLAQLRHGRMKSSEETIAKALEGDYRREHLVTLRQSLELYRVYQQKIDALDLEMEAFMMRLPGKVDLDRQPLSEKRANKGRVKKQHNAPAFDLRTHCYRLLGVDLTEIPGIDEVTVHLLVTEVGPDFSKFPSMGEFCNWLGLCPNNRVSSGRVLSRSTRKVSNRLTNGLRQAAQTLWSSQSALGAYYRRKKAQWGPAKATTCAAHKLARIIYHLVTTGQSYSEAALAQIDEQQAKYRLAKMRKQARQIGYDLVPTPAV